MTLRDSISSAIAAQASKWKGKDAEKDEVAGDTSAGLPATGQDAASSHDVTGAIQGVDATKPTIPSIEEYKRHQADIQSGAEPISHAASQATALPPSGPHTTAAEATLTAGPSSSSMSRSPSASSGFNKYKEKLKHSLPVGQFDIENATALPLNISLNQIGPLYYDIVKPGDVFSRQTGKVWFTIEIRLHLGPASEYSTWSVAWPIMLMAGPSAAALSLAAIPLIVLFTGTASITAIVAAAVEGVTAAFSSVATALGVANKLPFASKYRNKAIGHLKTQAANSQTMAKEVFNTINSKGGIRGYLDHLKTRGGEPNLIEMPENPSSVHDITGAELAEVLDVQGPGPKGWKKKRWNALKKDLEHVKLVDRGWFAGREPNLRVVGGPRIVTVDNPFPKNSGEKRTILEIYPLKLEKVVESDTTEGGILFEQVASGESSQEAADTKKLVEKAAEVMRD